MKVKRKKCLEIKQIWKSKTYYKKILKNLIENRTEIKAEKRKSKDDTVKEKKL